MAKRPRPDTVLVTGCAGFIGMHVAERLLQRGHRVVGLDSVNNYYSVKLKNDRLRRLFQYDRFRFYKAKLEELGKLRRVFDQNEIDRVCHLAAQAGVRYSITHPFAYLHSNLVGFQNVIHVATQARVGNFVYASSSSVYGANKVIPFSAGDRVDHPVSLYAATKKANELVAHAYHSIHGLPTTGLRFFTVYGPWGRPDMALFIFTKAILEGRPIKVFNHGKMMRDFTFIDDIVDGVVASLDRPFPYEVFNLGNNRPVPLTELIGCIERQLGRKARKKLLPMQPGDVPKTCADIRTAVTKLGFRPKTPFRDGVSRFVAWYRGYYGQ